jgi:hypothetical protein
MVQANQPTSSTEPLRVPSRILPSAESLASRRAMARQLRFPRVSTFGRAITLKAAEFLPSIYNPGAHTALESIARGVDYACEHLGIDVEQTVSGNMPLTVGDRSISVDFFGASASIVGSIVTFTDNLASVLVETMDVGDDWIMIDDDRCLDRVKANEALRQRWERFFLRFAGLSFKNATLDPILNDRQNTIKFQLTSAIEVFLLAREYAHHAIRQNAKALWSLITPCTGEFRHELEADEFALIIAKVLGSCGFSGSVTEVRNTWMESGAGVVATLKSVEAIRRVRETLETSTHLDEDSLARPLHLDRLIALENWSGFAAEPLKAQFYCQRRLVGRLIPSIYNELKMTFPAAHKLGYRPRHAELHKAAQDAARAGTASEGLVEIIAKDVIDFTRSQIKKPRNSTGIVAHLKLSTAGDIATDVREYLGHRQNKSINDFAEHFVAARIGAVEPNVAKLLAQRLRVGRTSETGGGFQELVEMYSYWIEQACAKIGLPLHGGVACGVVWHPAFEPIQQNFFGTSTSRIEIPEWTLMLCHFFSKLLARAIKITVEGERLALLLNAKTVRAKILLNPRLRDYAAEFLSLCATWDWRSFKPMKKVTGKSKTVYWHLLTASEIFVVAHEYAHHILDHNSGGSASVEGPDGQMTKIQELDADWIAGLISGHVAVDLKNPFAHFGGGGVLALYAVDMLRRAKSILSTGADQEVASDTHPSLEARLVNLRTLRYDPRNVAMARDMQQNIAEVMEAVWSLIVPDLQKMHARGVRPLSTIPADLRWLKFGPAAEL